MPCGCSQPIRRESPGQSVEGSRLTRFHDLLHLELDHAIPDRDRSTALLTLVLLTGCDVDNRTGIRWL